MSGLRMTGRLRSLALVLAAGAFMVGGLSSTAAYASEAAPQSAEPQIGIQFHPDGTGQCEGRTGEQWATSPNWTEAIRFDTDNRPGGCQLAFGVTDPDGTLAGSSISYQLTRSAGGVGQCGDNLGPNAVPMLPIPAFGTPVRVDTDSQPGWCNLTFTVTGRIVLDVQLYADGEPGQCSDSSPVTRSAFANSPVTVKIDTDGRSGGCQFLLRLRHF
ncbi:hypothetical protein ACFT4A_31540 [Streptomyces sp. NPDC057099]|uniref:hypothetical protein n=1 Tax=Streptomyces sp. NPDC057099 TaxID=3346019 RepID=UPI00363F393C